MAYEKLTEIIKNSNNIVFLGGAGVSTESNIPDFRREDGLYAARNEYGYPPEVLISRSFFDRNKEIFFDYYKKNLVSLNAKPNPAHYALAELERMGKLKAVVTQNIDGLHQMAGSKNVLELHGSIHRNYCMRCGKFFDAAYVKNSEGAPKCDECGGLIKPDVVLYEEGLDENVISKTIHYISQADVLIIGGTSLVVYPAAGLIDYFKGSHLILINKSATQRDSQADLVINDKIGEVFGQL